MNLELPQENRLGEISPPPEMPKAEAPKLSELTEELKHCREILDSDSQFSAEEQGRAYENGIKTIREMFAQLASAKDNDACQSIVKILEDDISIEHGLGSDDEGSGQAERAAWLGQAVVMGRYDFVGYPIPGTIYNSSRSDLGRFYPDDHHESYFPASVKRFIVWHITKRRAACDPTSSIYHQLTIYIKTLNQQLETR
jgi:hypothetical protein